MLHIVLRTGSKEDFSICKVEVMVQKASKLVSSPSNKGELTKSAFPLNKLVASVRENMPSGTLVTRIPTKLNPNRYSMQHFI